MAHHRQEELIKILMSRNLPIDHDAMKIMFGDPQNQIIVENWMSEFLGPETLLTQEEFMLYESLKSSGEYDKVASTHDLSTIESLSDDQIENAIEDLEQSTAAIEKQTAVLDMQQEAMRKLMKENARGMEVKQQMVEHQARRWESERAQCDAEIQEVARNLKVRIEERGQEQRVSEVTLKQNVASILKSDDKLLASLQKLAGDLDSGQPQDEKTMIQIRELCARLIKYTVEGVRTKLDRIYLESLKGSKTRAAGDQKDKQEVVELKEELESLYSEILSVAQMSAEQRFLTPALHAVEAKNNQVRVRSAKGIEYIQDCLEFITTRLETVAKRVEGFESHKMALRAMIHSAESELCSPRPTSPVESSTTTKSGTRKASMTEARKGSVSQALIPGRSTRRRSSLQKDEDIDAEQQLLRNLGISLPPNSMTPKDRLQAFEAALLDRKQKLDAHTEGLQALVEESISSHLHDARIVFQILQDTLLSETVYHTPRLVDEDIEEAIKMLEDEIADLDGGIEELDLRSLQARNVHRDRYITLMEGVNIR